MRSPGSLSSTKTTSRLTSALCSEIALHIIPSPPVAQTLSWHCSLPRRSHPGRDAGMGQSVDLLLFVPSFPLAPVKSAVTKPCGQRAGPPGMRMLSALMLARMSNLERMPAMAALMSSCCVLVLMLNSLVRLYVRSPGELPSINFAL